MKIFKWVLRGLLAFLIFIFIVGVISNPGLLAPFGAGIALLFIGWAKLNMVMPETKKKIDKKAKKTAKKSGKSFWRFLFY